MNKYNINNNKKCYEFKTIKICEKGNGLFDRCIDMAYIITMTDSKRYSLFMNQLKKNLPFHNITIQFNKGFKKCNKKLNKKTSKFDINDAFRNIFEHANDMNYKNILVFEDDFIMDKTKYNIDDIQNISNFVNSLKGNFVYNLGPMIHFSLPFIKNIDHQKSIFFLSAHAVIYSRKYRECYLNDYLKNKIKCANDRYWNKIKIQKYIYHKPIIFQLYSNTENSNLSNNKFVQKIIKFLKLDSSYENFSKISKLFSIITFLFFIGIILLCIFILFIIIKKYRKKIHGNKKYIRKKYKKNI